MAANEITILSHPFFIATFIVGVGAVGSLITMLFVNTKDHAEFRQAIIDIRNLVEKLERETTTTKQEFDRVKGQHDMIINAGNVLKSHAKKSE